MRICDWDLSERYKKGLKRTTNKIPLDDLLILCEGTHTDLDYFFRPLRKLNKKLYINGRDDNKIT